MTRYVSIVVVLLLGVGCDQLNRPEPSTPPSAAAQPLGATVFKVSLDGAPSEGRADAPVTLVEFTDYQCPFCGRANGTVEQLREKYGEQLRVVLRENPLPMHPQARAAALAALAAGEQGKYWQMHTALFAHQKQLSDALYPQLAKELGLDTDRFDSDRKSGRLEAVLDRDLGLGQKLGVRGTPAFFINGRPIVGAQPQAQFATLIDAELAHAQQLRDQGVAADGIYAAAVAHGLDAAPAAPQQAEAASSKVEQVELGSAVARGATSAPVTVVAFSDFQCPFCSRAETTLKALDEAYPGKLRFVMLQKPLPFHDHARDAAKVALAAGEQGKFWEMHDLLFAHQTQLDRPALEGYAQQLGLDVARFRSAMDAPDLEAQIAADEHEAARLGVQGTPTFFVNGHRIVGAQPLATFKPVIDAALAQR